MIHAFYDFVLAMDSFTNMPYCCKYACFVMHCFVVSASSSPRCLHIIVSAMLCFLLSRKPVNETCYVYMLAIISSGTFWLMVSKGLLSYALSRFIPCLCFLCSVLVRCWFRALNIATWCCFCHVQWFLQSLKLLLFAILPCLFEHVLVIYGNSSVFMFCHALPLNHVHAFCSHVGML